MARKKVFGFAQGVDITAKGGLFNLKNLFNRNVGWKFTQSTFQLARALAANPSTSKAQKAIASSMKVDVSIKDLEELKSRLQGIGIFDGPMAQSLRAKAMARCLLGETLVPDSEYYRETLAKECRKKIVSAKRRMLGTQGDAKSFGRLTGALIPHGRLNVTGDLAADVFARMSGSHWPDVVIVLGTSHFGSKPGLLMRDVWTPLGNISTDRKLAAALLKQPEFSFEKNHTDFIIEHSWMIKLPLLQAAAKEAGRPVKLLAMIMGNMSAAEGRVLGRVLSDLLYKQDKTGCLIASGDLTHLGVKHQWVPNWAAKTGPVSDILRKIEVFDRGALNALVKRDHKVFDSFAEQSSFCARAQVSALMEFVDSDGDVHGYKQIFNTRPLRNGPGSRRWKAKTDHMFTAASVTFSIGQSRLPKSGGAAEPTGPCSNTILGKGAQAGNISHRCTGEEIHLGTVASDIYLEFLRSGSSLPEAAKALSTKWKRKVSPSDLAPFIGKFTDMDLMHQSLAHYVDPRRLHRKAQDQLLRCRREVPFYKTYPEQFQNAPFIDAKTIVNHWPEFTRRDSEAVLQLKNNYRRRTSGSTNGKGLLTVVEHNVHKARGTVVGLVNPEFISTSAVNQLNRPSNLDLRWSNIKKVAIRTSKNSIAITPGPDPSAVDDHTWDRVIEIILKRKKTVLEGDPAYLAGLARRCLTHGLKLDHLDFVGLSHSYAWQMYTDPIRQAFGVPVWNLLKTSEAGTLAAPCELGRMHLIERHLTFEIINQGKPVSEGEVGALALTTTDTQLRPLIRYLNGDVIRLLANTCECGRPFRTIEYMGRIKHLIPDARGVPVTYRELDELIGAPPGIKYFRLKDLAKHLTLELVSTSQTIADASLVKKRLEQHLGRRVRIVWKKNFGVTRGKLVPLECEDRLDHWYQRYLRQTPLA